MDRRNSFAMSLQEEDVEQTINREITGRRLIRMSYNHEVDWTEDERSALARRTNLILGDTAARLEMPTPVAEAQDMMDDGDVESATEEDMAALEPASEPSIAHLREISPLASWTVSTFKPGCGVEALRSPSTAQFWQSDGPQPHLLNIHFFKLVSIVKMRVYLDFELDESYTPTRILFFAGMGMYDLTEFAEWTGEGPKGWVDVSLEGVGSGGGNVLRAMVVQIRVVENHQNGKDTHVRGVQLFSRDDRVGRKGKNGGEFDVRTEGVEEVLNLEELGWRREPELR